jgi:hypothetical protein
MTRHTEIGLYSGRRLVASPNASLDQVLAYGRRNGASYLVVDDREITTLRPQLSILLDPAHAPSELEYVRTFGDVGGAASLCCRTLIYRLRE